MIAPDKKTFNYIHGREFTPKNDDWNKAMKYWSNIKTDDEAVFDKEILFDGSKIEPMITYGTNPGMGMKIRDKIPKLPMEGSKDSFHKSLNYMGLKSGTHLLNKKIDYVFIGSCTNSRMEDLRIAAKFIDGKQKASGVSAWVIPGSKQVEKMAKEEGIDKIFKDAGFEFRQPGCSACLAMNEDKIPKNKFCVSTSNRNFEGRQGPGSRTMLASPLTAAATAVNGYVTVLEITFNYGKI